MIRKFMIISEITLPQILTTLEVIFCIIPNTSPMYQSFQEIRKRDLLDIYSEACFTFLHGLLRHQLLFFPWDMIVKFIFIEHPHKMLWTYRINITPQCIGYIERFLSVIYNCISFKACSLTGKFKME